MFYSAGTLLKKKRETYNRSFKFIVFAKSIIGKIGAKPGMTETGEKTVLPQSTTNDRVSNKICYVDINLFTNDV